MTNDCFLLLRKVQGGWTDIHGDEAHRFPSAAEAWMAANELDKVWGTNCEWRVETSADIDMSELVC
jgi:hypothetical protein